MIEDTNTVGLPAAQIQEHVFECHDAIRMLRRENAELRATLRPFLAPEPAFDIAGILKRDHGETVHVVAKVGDLIRAREAYDKS